jgi:type II secretory pathway component PulM
MTDEQLPEEDTLTNIRALREDIVVLHSAGSKDGAKRHRLVVLALGAISCLLIVSVLMVSQMFLGVDAIQEDQRATHDNIERVLVVTTALARDGEAARAAAATKNVVEHPTVVMPPEPPLEVPRPSEAPVP